MDHIFLKLSSRQLPMEIPPGQVIPLLFWDSDERQHRWALLTSSHESNNRATQMILESLGFVEEISYREARFYVIGGAHAPISQFDGTDYFDNLPSPGGSNETRFPTDDGDLVIVDAPNDLSLKPHPRALPLIPNSLPDLLHCRNYGDTVGNFNFWFSTNGADIAPGFEIRIQPIDLIPDVNGTPVVLPQRVFAFRHEGGLEGRLTVQGDEDPDSTNVDARERIELTQGQAVVAAKTVLHLDLALESDFGPVRFGPGWFMGLKISRSGLRFGLRKDGLGLYLNPDLPLEVELEYEAPLCMADLIDASSNKEPTFLTTLQVINGVEQLVERPLTFKLAVELDEWEPEETEIALFKEGEALHLQPDLFEADVVRAKMMDVVLDKSTEISDLATNISDLVGKTAGAVEFNLDSVAPDLFSNQVDFSNLRLPVKLDIKLGVGNRSATVILALPFDLYRGRLRENRLYFYFDIQDNPDAQWIDLEFCSLRLPHRRPRGSGLAESRLALPSKDSCDGYVSLDGTELVIAPRVDAEQTDAPPIDEPSVRVYIPGGISSESNEEKKRFQFELQPFQPDVPPGTEPPDPILMRIGHSGISFSAQALLSEVDILPAGESSRGMRIQPLAERKGVHSELIIIDNQVRSAVVVAEAALPGVKDLVVAVEAGLRQRQGDANPTFFIGMELEASDGAPLVELDLGMMDLELSDVRLDIDWNGAVWGVGARVDGSLSFSNSIAQTGGLESLQRQRAIKIRDLNLFELDQGIGGIEFALDGPVEFEFLDGLIGCRLHDLGFSWDNGKARLSCRRAELSYTDQGEIEVNIAVGGLDIEFTSLTEASLKLPNAIGIEVRIEEAVKYSGQLVWVDTKKERYFACAGGFAIESLPEVRALLKLGSGRKENGRMVPNIAVFGELEQEVQLFPAVMTKSIGAGVGLNNRLTGIDADPTADELLRNIDQIRPDRIEGWSFVEADGNYLSIVGSTVLGSSAGGGSAYNAYVASLVISLDTKGTAVAAGKLWLSSSADFVRRRENWDRPALVGAFTLVPKRGTLEAALVTRSSPAMEKGGQLSRILDKGRARFSFRLSPELVDYHLQELIYSDKFFGADMDFSGGYRFAVFQREVLARAGLHMLGRFGSELSEGSGGFKFSGDLDVNLEYGGLLSDRGIDAYALIDARMKFHVEAWIEVSITLGWGRWKKQVGKTFRSPSQTLDLGIDGSIAFNSSGQFGLHAAVSLSLSICGYGLRISPILSRNRELVDTIRSDAARFEERLDTYIRESGTKLIAVTPLADPAELIDQDEWLHYESQQGKKTYHLLLPKLGAGHWLTPAYDPDRVDDDSADNTPFKSQVTKITVPVMDGGGKVTSYLELYMPWHSPNLDEFDDPSDELKNRMDEVEAIMLQTSAPDGSAIAPIELNGFEIVRDPRCETTSDIFLREEDRFGRPDYVLPIDFAPIDEVIGSVTPGVAEADLKLARDYVSLRSRARRVTLHRGEDLDEADSLGQKRAGIVAILRDELRNPDASNKFGVIAGDGTSKRLGLIFSLEKEKTFDVNQITIERAMDNQKTKEFSPTFTSTGDNFDQLVPHVEPLPVRQKFVPRTEGATSAPHGKVTVKLPVRLSDDLLLNNLHRLSHFEIYRRFGNQEWERIDDFAQPELTLLNEPELSDGAPPGPASLLVNPYLYTDEIEVKDGRFVVPGLARDRTPVQYKLRMMQTGELTVEAGDVPGRDRVWASVPLFIPDLDPFPRQLLMVLPVETLSRRRGHASFLLRTVEGETTLPARLNSREMGPGDIELWAQEVPLNQSGFFVGGEYQDPRPSSAPTQRSLRRLRNERHLESTEGKFKVDLVPEIDKFQFQLGSFRPGFGYCLFIRPSASESHGLLAPVGFRLVHALDELATDKSRYAEQLEWFPQELVSSWCHGWTRGGLPLLNKTQFAVDEVIQGTENQLRVLWEAPHRMRESVSINGKSTSYEDQLGGVEILIQDADESPLRYRLRCEVLGDDVFRVSERHFANAARWRLPPRAAGAAKRILPPSLPPLRSDADVVDFFFRGQSDTEHDLFAGLQAAAKEVYALVTEIQTAGYKWTKILAIGRAWMDAVHAFRRSPLNPDDSHTRALLRSSLLTFRLLVLGHSDDFDMKKWLNLADKNRVLALEQELEHRQREMRDKAEEAESLSLNNLDLSDPKRAQADLNDRIAAKKLAAILRRRDACADDTLYSEDEQVPMVRDDNGKLPREAAWNPNDVTGPYSDWFRQHFDAAVPTGDSKALALFKCLIKYLNPLEPNSHFRGIDFRRRLAALVPKARGLAAAIDQLENDLESFQVIERPHHQVGVAPAEDADGRTAEHTDIRVFLSNAARIPERIDRDGTTTGKPPEFSDGYELQVSLEGDGESTTYRWKDGSLAQTVPPGPGFENGSGGPSVCSPSMGACLVAEGNFVRLVPGGDRSAIEFSHSELVVAVAFASFRRSPKGSVKVGVLTATEDGNVRLWDIGAKPSIHKTYCHGKGLSHIAFALLPWGARLVTAGAYCLKIWDLGASDKPLTIQHHKGPLVGLAVLQWSQQECMKDVPRWHIVTASNSGVLQVWSLQQEEDGEGVIEVQGNPMVHEQDLIAFAVAHSPRGPRLLVGDENGAARLWDPVTRRHLATLDHPEIITVDLDYAATGGTAVTAGPKDVKVWHLDEDAVGAKSILERQLQPGPVKSIRLQRLEMSSEVASLAAPYYFNLLERMGFAVDLAVVDDLNQPLGQKELLQRVSQSLREITITHVLEDHRVLLLAGREPDADYDKKVEVGYSFLKLALIPNLFLTLTRDPGRTTELKAWYDLRKVDLGEDPDCRAANIGQIREVACYVEALVDEQNQLFANQVGTRWQSVASLDGISHALWTLPDRAGHRLRVAIRPMSRYEPLIRWWKGQRGTYDFDLSGNTALSPDYYHSAGLRRVMDAASIEDTGRVKPLVSVPYPHPTRIQLGYQLPADGARAIYNGISEIRSGFAGCSVDVPYRILDKQRPDNTTLATLLRSIVHPDPNQHLGTEGTHRVEPIPHNLAFSVRLLRHERLMRFEHLPFFYRYGLQVQPDFDARWLGDGPTSIPIEGPLAERKPTLLGTRAPSRSTRTGSGTPDDPWEFELIIWLSKAGDHLTRDESEASPEPLNLAGFEVERLENRLLAAHELPDLAMGYELLYRVPSQPGVDTGRAFFRVAELRLPWHLNAVGNEHELVELKPFGNAVTVALAGGDAGRVIEYRINEINRSSIAFAIRLKVTVTIPAFKHVDRYVLQPSRDGYTGRLMSIAEETRHV